MKNHSSSHSKVFSNLIAADVKCSSFKTEDSLPLEDRAFSNGPVHSSCIYKSKYDVATKNRERAPHLKLVSAIFLKCLFFHQMITLKKL